MKNYKRAQAVMLPTTEETAIVLNPNTNKLRLSIDIANSICPINEHIELGFIAQHLHIISDDEIKEDDWCLVGVYPHQKVKQCAELAYGQDGKTVNGYLFTDGTKHSASDCKKIISATDTSLEIYDRELSVRHKEEIKILLPQPSQQFIEKYIEAYDRDDIITDVLVEYEEGGTTYDIGSGNPYYTTNYNLKVNPKGNTITIKELKDNWSRKEVIDLILTVLSQYKILADTNNVSSWSTNKWIEENL